MTEYSEETAIATKVLVHIFVYSNKAFCVRFYIILVVLIFVGI